MWRVGAGTRKTWRNILLGKVHVSHLNSRSDSDLPGEFGSPQQYVDTLMLTLRGQLKRMYNLGARKFAILRVALIACCPSLRIETGLCNEGANSFVLGKFHADVPCLPIAELCDDRGSFLFWDSYHPTEAAVGMVIDRFFSGTHRR
ncbi:hypothetical protein MKX01_022588 [Papaver californicum]|nr:hypothetical protein MKX01_022588 [Papaver californicum]